MVFSRTVTSIALMALFAVLLLSSTARAESAVKCYAHGDANKLAYCLATTVRGGAAGMDAGTAQLYTILASQQVAPPTVMPTGYAYYPYGYLPMGMAYAEPTATAAIGNVAASMMSAAAWAYNWKHGYVGANGIWGAAYLMNYPW